MVDQETSYEQVKSGMEEIAERTRGETGRWRSRVDAGEGIQRVLDRGKGV